MRVITANLNGIRSASSKGFMEWASAQDACFIGVQEVKAQGAEVHGIFDQVGDLRGHFHFAEKKGYSGVGLYSRHEPSDVVTGFGVREFDDEGRWVELRFDKPGRKMSIISSYFPSGSSSEERQLAKFRFLESMAEHLAGLGADRDFILMGDINIAHKQADLKNWKSNQKNSGFLPEERAWMTTLLSDGPARAGLVDVYRRLYPDATDDCYTWWSNRGAAYSKNVGWRLDYHIATSAVASTARGASIFKASKFSDHAPLSIDYDMNI